LQAGASHTSQWGIEAPEGINTSSGQIPVFQQNTPAAKAKYSRKLWTNEFPKWQL